jgi:uncharacterized protein YjeT (DUF2065 family)
MRTAGGYSIRDATRRAVAFVYFVEGFREPNSGKPLSPEEGKQIAEAIARLPDHGLV